jgi:hypothetical protein
MCMSQQDIVIIFFDFGMMILFLGLVWIYNEYFCFDWPLSLLSVYKLGLHTLHTLLFYAQEQSGSLFLTRTTNTYYGRLLL